MRRKGSRGRTTRLSPGVATSHVQAAENASHAGESRSSFVDRALAARDEARRTGEYFTADEVLRELHELHARTLASPRK